MPLSAPSPELPAACRRPSSPHIPRRAGRPERESHQGRQAGERGGAIQRATAQDGVLQDQSGGECRLSNVLSIDFEI